MFLGREHYRFRLWASALAALLGPMACGVEPSDPQVDDSRDGRKIDSDFHQKAIDRKSDQTDEARVSEEDLTAFDGGILLGNGSACTMSSQCSSGFCVDGVCCNSSCTATCQACSAVKKGGGSDGACGNIAAATDPDNECAAGECNGLGACGVPSGTDPNGTACASGATCLSGNCIDGVCCNDGCVGTCRACTASKKGSGANGVCGNIAFGQDPDDECAVGTCNGAGACGKGGILLGNGIACSMGSQCASGFCTDGVCCNASCSSTCQACSATKKGSGADGQCGSIGAGLDPDNECAGACNGAAACDAGVPASNGTPCQAAGQCQSGFCVDGVCCNLPCSGVCSGCSVLATGYWNGQEGVCTSVEGGLDPRNACTYECNGGGACNQWAPEADGATCDYDWECISGHCVDGVCCQSGCFGLCQRCDLWNGIADGVCDDIVAGNDPDGECKFSCNGSGACGPSPGASLNGTNCSTDADCASGLCVDGICCDSACDGNCQACNLVGSVGTCSTYCPGACVGTNGFGGTASSIPTLLYGNNWAIDAADLNGDSIPEVAIARDGTVMLYKGLGNGTFGESYATADSTAGRALVFADLDDNGWPDIVVANAAAGNVSVFRNVSAYAKQWYGYITRKVTYPTGVVGPVTTPQPDMLRVADLNGDGRRDIAVANTASGTVTLLFGQANALHFPTRTDISVPSNPKAIAIADVNGNGKPDLAVATYDAATTNYRVSVLMGNGNGTFGAPVHYPIGKNCTSLAAADFNGDGNQDLVSGNFDSNAGHKVYVLINQGNGTFASAVSYAVAGVSRVVPADMNGDGLMDLAVSGNEYRSLEVLIGQGNGAFAPALHYPTFGRSYGLAVADLDNDGDKDVVTANVDNFVSLKNDGNGVFGSAMNSEPTIPLAGRIVRSGDVNGDGNADLVSVGDSGIQAVLGFGNGTFGSVVASSSVSQGIVRDASLADANGDGKVDLIYQRTGGGMSVQLSLGNGSFGPESQYSLPPAPDRLLVADFDGDAKVDVVTSGFSDVPCQPPWNCRLQNIYIGLRRGNGDGTFGALTMQNVSSLQVYYSTSKVVAIGAGDFDGNGTVDVVLTDSEWRGSREFSNQGNGTFGTSAYVGDNYYSNANFAPDLDGDGKANYLHSNVTSVSAYLPYNGLSGGVWFVPAATDLITTDLDNDGLLDIVTASSTEKVVSVLLQNETYDFGPRRDYSVGVASTSVAAGDWNKDGKMDLAVQNYGAGNVSILLNSCLP